MKNKMTLSESVLGWFYLFLSIFVMSSIMNFLNSKLPTPLSNAWLSFATVCFSFVIMVLILHTFLSTAATNVAKDSITTLCAMALGFCVYYTCTTLLSRYMSSYFTSFFNTKDPYIAAMLKLDFVPKAIGIIFLLPCVEEMLYRGVVFNSLHGHNRVLAYVLSTLIYSSVHLMGYATTQEPITLFWSFVHYLPAGFTLAWVYVRADNIFAPILLHMVINAMGVFSVR